MFNRQTKHRSLGLYPIEEPCIKFKTIVWKVYTMHFAVLNIIQLFQMLREYSQRIVQSSEKAQAIMFISYKRALYNFITIEWNP